MGPARATEAISAMDPQLEDLLSRIERVAKLYLTEALHITCVETIKRSGLSGP